MYASSLAFVRRVDHSSFILSCNLIGQRENKSRYVTEIVLPLGYADVIFRRRESRQPEIRLRSQASLIVAEFILEANYPSRRIIRQTDNSSKYKSEDEF